MPDIMKVCTKILPGGVVYWASPAPTNQEIVGSNLDRELGFGDLLHCIAFLCNSIGIVIASLASEIKRSKIIEQI
jgi:hypothetical protein